MSDRCTGHCCKHFRLLISYEKLQDAFVAKTENNRDWFAKKYNSPLPSQVEIIAQMVISLGNGYYTCCHLKKNGDCGIYKYRPEMCKAFPYGRTCQIPECTWEEAKTFKENRLPDLRILQERPLLIDSPIVSSAYEDEVGPQNES